MRLKRIAALFTAIFILISLAGCDLLSGRQEQSDTPETSGEAAIQAEGSGAPAIFTLPVILYLPNESKDGFIAKAALTDGKPEHIVSLLAEDRALPKDCELLDFAVNGNGSCRADLNVAYGQAIGEGTTAEYLRLGCVVNTLLTYFELEEITITVEGKAPETGHEVYDYPLRFYEDQIADFGEAETQPIMIDTPDSGAPGSTVPPDVTAGYADGNENDLSVFIANLPRSDAVDGIWHRLGGYWTAADNLFTAFVIRDGIPGIEYGIWESWERGFGEFVNADPMSDYTVALTIRFPAMEANEISDARPETTTTVFIDVSGLDNDGKINIKIEGHGDGGYCTYAYGGATSEEAYRNIRP
jgi:hypothetical protein